MKISTLFFLLFLLGLAWTPSTAQDSTATPVTTPLQRPTVLSTGLPTPIQAQPLQSPSPTRRVNATSSATSTETATATATLTSTSTATATARATDTLTATSTATQTRTATETRAAATTVAPVVVETDEPTDTHTPTDTPTLTPTATATATASATPSITATASATVTPSLTPTVTETPIPINVINTTKEEDSGTGSLTLIVLGVVVLAGAYVSLYALNSASQDRYSTGFVIQRCPVCLQGTLEIEERPYRSMGIPRVRRTVRCDTCRSVLREVGRKKWRYAVDPNANPAMYEEYNSRELSESELMGLTAPASTNEKPHYLDEE